MNTKISVFPTCIEGTIYLLLYNLHDCTFNIKTLLKLKHFKRKNLTNSSENVHFLVSERRMDETMLKNKRKK